jgi:hypothetical protein
VRSAIRTRSSSRGGEGTAGVDELVAPPGAAVGRARSAMVGDAGKGGRRSRTTGRRTDCPGLGRDGSRTGSEMDGRTRRRETASWGSAGTASFVPTDITTEPRREAPVGDQHGLRTTSRMLSWSGERFALAAPRWPLAAPRVPSTDTNTSTDTGSLALRLRSGHRISRHAVATAILPGLARPAAAPAAARPETLPLPAAPARR